MTQDGVSCRRLNTALLRGFKWLDLKHLEGTAAEDSRTPKPSDKRKSRGSRASVLECGCPLPLWIVPRLLSIS
jgi:hypothetical protein